MVHPDQKMQYALVDPQGGVHRSLSRFPFHQVPMVQGGLGRQGLPIRVGKHLEGQPKSGLSLPGVFLDFRAKTGDRRIQFNGRAKKEKVALKRIQSQNFRQTIHSQGAWRFGFELSDGLEDLLRGDYPRKKGFQSVKLASQITVIGFNPLGWKLRIVHGKFT